MVATMVTAIGNLAHHLADKMDAKPADRPILDRKRRIGWRYFEWIELLAIIDHLGSHRAGCEDDTNLHRRRGAAAMAQHIADKFVEGDKHLGGCPGGDFVFLKIGFDHFQQFGLAAVLARADLDDLASTQAIKLVCLRVKICVVRLVGHANHGLIDVSQSLGDLLVQRRDAGAGR